MKYLFILTSTWHYPRTALGGGGDRVWWLTVAAPCVTGEVGASVVCGLGGVWVVYGGGELVVPLVEVVNGGGVLYLLRNIFAKLGNMASKKMQTLIHSQDEKRNSASQNCKEMTSVYQFYLFEK